MKTHKNILVADDDAAISRLLEAIIKREGFNVLSCRNGEEVLKELKSQKTIDLIICDELMPLGKGSEIAEFLKQEVGYSTIPFILLSAEENPRHFTDLMTRRIIDVYLPKPVNQKQLMAIINLCLHQHSQNYQFTPRE